MHLGRGRRRKNDIQSNSMQLMGQWLFRLNKTKLLVRLFFFNHKTCLEREELYFVYILIIQRLSCYWIWWSADLDYSNVISCNVQYFCPPTSCFGWRVVAVTTSFGTNKGSTLCKVARYQLTTRDFFGGFSELIYILYNH